MHYVTCKRSPTFLFVRDASCGCHPWLMHDQLSLARVLLQAIAPLK